MRRRVVPIAFQVHTQHGTYQSGMGRSPILRSSMQHFSGFIRNKRSTWILRFAFCCTSSTRRCSIQVLAAAAASVLPLQHRCWHDLSVLHLEHFLQARIVLHFFRTCMHEQARLTETDHLRAASAAEAGHGLVTAAHG